MSVTPPIQVEVPRSRLPECKAVTCPLCRCPQNATVIIGRDWLYDVPGEYRVVRCADCRHLYLNPRPETDDLTNIYPSQYVPHQPQPEPSDVLPRPGRMQRALRLVPGLRPVVRWLLASHATLLSDLGPGPKRVLEMGCGNGRFLDELRHRGWEAVGVEPIAAAASIARARAFTVHAGTLESAQFPAASFDGAFAWMVLEHTPDPIATLTELRRVLRPRGLLALSVPNAGCWERHVFGRYWHAWSLPTHFQHFTIASLRHVLTTSGFDIVQVVPQKNLLNVVGSFGIALKAARPQGRIGRWLLNLADDPPAWLNLILSPAAHGLAAIGQSGRLTVVARSRD